MQALPANYLHIMHVQLYVHTCMRASPSPHPYRHAAWYGGVVVQYTKTLVVAYLYVCVYVCKYAKESTVAFWGVLHREMGKQSVGHQAVKRP